jgi:hypothetical protein
MSLEIGDTRPMNISIAVNVRTLYIDLPAIEASAITDFISHFFMTGIIFVAYESDIWGW